MTEHHSINLTELAKARDGSGHSIFSPSGSPMWLTCLGSLIANLLVPDDAGPDAAYGTVAHELTEQQLKTGKAQTHRIGEVVWVEAGDWGHLVEIDAEMLAYVQMAVDFCEWLPGEHFVEERVYFSEYTPLKRQSGTCDHAACEPGVMTVTDHKFGKGVRVYAAKNYKSKRAVIRKVDGTFELNGNSQGLLYALGFFLKYDEKYNFQRIIIRIAQPRLDHWDEWETTREELLKFGEFVRERAALAWRPNAPRSPSLKGCQWCKVKSNCAAFAVQQEQIMSAAFDDLLGDISVETIEDLKERLDDPLGGYEIQRVDVGTLSIDQMATLFAYRRAADSWWNQLEKALKKLVAQGEPVPGMKLVEGRSIRKFANKDKTITGLQALGLKRSEVVEEKLASPAEVEKLLVKRGHRVRDLPELLRPLVIKPPGKATLVPISDKRPELTDVSSVVFDADDDLTRETEL